MKCDQVRENLSSYIDEGLSQVERSAIETHLPSCSNCNCEYVALTKMLDALHSMKTPAAPDLLPGIHRQLEHQPWWKELSQRFLAPWPISFPVRGLAVATLAVLVVAIVGLPKFGTQSPSEHLQLASSKVASVSESVELDYLARGERRQMDSGRSFQRVAEKRDKIGAKVSALSDQKSHVETQQRPANTPASKSIEQRFADSLPSSVSSSKPFQIASAINTPAELEAPARARMLSKEKVGEDRVDYYDADVESSNNKIAETVVGGIAGASVAIRGMQRQADKSNITLAQAPVISAEPLLSAGLLLESEEKVEEGGYHYDDLSDIIESKESKSTDSPADRQVATTDFKAQWIVPDREVAFVKVAEWVDAHQGTLSVEGERHLRIQLAGADVDAFLAKFSTSNQFKEKSQILADARSADEVMVANKELLDAEKDGDFIEFGLVGRRLNKDAQVSIVLEIIIE